MMGLSVPGARPAPPFSIRAAGGRSRFSTAWLIGGPLVDGPGWRWNFFINIPVGLAALALSPGLLPEPVPATSGRA
jgi:hypothetical protein